MTTLASFERATHPQMLSPVPLHRSLCAVANSHDNYHRRPRPLLLLPLLPPLPLPPLLPPPPPPPLLLLLLLLLLPLWLFCLCLLGWRGPPCDCDPAYTKLC